MPSGFAGSTAICGPWLEPPHAARPPASSAARIRFSIRVLICLSRPAGGGCFRRGCGAAARTGDRLVGFPGYGLAVAGAGTACRGGRRNLAAACRALDDGGIRIGGGLVAIGGGHGCLLR